MLERLGFRQLVSRLWPDGPPAAGAVPDAPATVETVDADALLALPPETPLGVLPEDGAVTVCADGRLLRCPLDARLKGFFEDPARRLILWSIKDAVGLLRKAGIALHADCRDLSLVCYLLSPTGGGRTFAQAAGEYLGTGTPADAAALPALDAKAYPLLLQNEQLSLYEEIEKPLSYVLADMERDGFAVDADGLRAFGAQLEQGVREAEAHIYDLAGETFNINSPKQLGSVLFEKLGLPHYKRTAAAIPPTRTCSSGCGTSIPSSN